MAITVKMEMWKWFIKDGLHLQNSGKKILSQNFIVNLQSYDTFLEKRNKQNTWFKTNNV